MNKAWKHVLKHYKLFRVTLSEFASRKILLDGVQDKIFWILNHMQLESALPRTGTNCTVQSCWWQHYVDDFIMVTVLWCWWLNHYVGDLFRHVGDFFNVKNRSLTCQSCHQQKKSTTSIVKIDLDDLFEFQTKSIGVLNRQYGRYADEMTIFEFFYRSWGSTCFWIFST